MGGFAAVVQNVMNGAVDLDLEFGRGTGRWYIVEHWQRADDTRGMMLAHYDDAYVREESGWVFARRLLVPHYAGPNDLTAPFLNALS
jgi:hypothetical protein